MLKKYISFTFVLVLVLQMLYSLPGINTAAAQSGTCYGTIYANFTNNRTGQTVNLSYDAGEFPHSYELGSMNVQVGDSISVSADKGQYGDCYGAAYPEAFLNGGSNGYFIDNGSSYYNLYFSPVSLTYLVGSGDSMITGTFTTMCIGMCGDTTGTITLMFNMSQAPSPDFSLSCSPSTQTITTGGSASFNLSTTSLNGFNSAVGFSHSTSPDPGGGASIGYTNNGAVPSATTTATVSTNGGISPGTYTITFTGSGGGKSYSCNVTLVVNAPVTLSTSTNLAIYQTPSVTLQINGSNSATIVAGNSATLSWTPTATNSGTACTAGNAWSGGKSSTPGSTYTESTGTMNSAGTYTYTLVCSGALSTNTSTQSVTLTVTAAPDFSFFSCTPASQTILAGSTTSFNINTSSLNGFNSAVTFTESFSPSSGTLPSISFTSNNAVPPATTTATATTTISTTPATYTITFTGTGGGKTHSCSTVLVVSPSVPTATIAANGSGADISIPYNTSATISWTSTNATSCTVSPLSASGTSGSQSSGNLTSNTTYTLTCTGPGGTATDSVTVNVLPLPAADLKANGADGPISIPYNTSATISWTSTNATSCTVSPLSASGTSGSQSSGNLTSNTTYTLTCTGPGGTATDSVVVSVQSNFSLNCTPATQTINAGGSTSFNLTTTSLNGFNSAVTFSHSFSPSSGTLPTVSYTNNGAAPSATTTATITSVPSTSIGTYTITFSGTGGGVTNTCATSLTVDNPVVPPPPVNVSAINSGAGVNCGTIGVSWSAGTGGSTPEGFRVYRRASTSDAWQQLGSNIPFGGTYSVVDSTPLNPNGSNYYAVTSYLAGSESLKAEPSTTPVVPIACSANLSLSDKDLIQVNGNNSSSSVNPVDCNGQSDVYQLPNNRLLKTGDTLRFKINVCNTGNQTLTNVRVVDVVTNLDNVAYVSSSGNCVSSYDSGTKTFNLNDLPAGGVCSIIMTAVVANPGGTAGSLYRFQNTANIQSTQLNQTVYTPPYLFSVGAGIPNRNETSP